MPSHRLGVALLLEAPWADEIDGLRRALGAPSLQRIAPHITLVAPVNVREDALDEALAALRAAAAAAPETVQLTLGPPTTFLPVTPVVYLAVGGDVAEVADLCERVSVGPLGRRPTRPFVPHVTLLDRGPVERLTGAVTVLADYQATITVRGVHLLEERVMAGQARGSRRRWVPLADAVFGGRAVVGRGGLALELTESTMLDPSAAGLMETATGDSAGETEASGAATAPGPSGPRQVVVTARREGQAVGVAVAWLADDGGHVAVVVDGDSRGQGIGGHLLAAVEVATDKAGWHVRRLVAHGPVGFYAARSARSRPAGD